MEKNCKAKIKKYYLILYCLVGVILIVESVFYSYSYYNKIMHYNYFVPNWITGEHVTYFAGVWVFAIGILILIPIGSVVFKKKSIRSFSLSAINLLINVLISIAIIITIEFFDSNWTFNSFGKLQKYSNSKVGITICTQEVYPDFASASDYMGYGCVYVETGFNQLKKVKEYALFLENKYDIRWEKESLDLIVSDSDNQNKQEITIRYKDLMD